VLCVDGVLDVGTVSLAPEALMQRGRGVTPCVSIGDRLSLLYSTGMAFLAHTHRAAANDGGTDFIAPRATPGAHPQPDSCCTRFCDSSSRGREWAI